MCKYVTTTKKKTVLSLLTKHPFTEFILSLIISYRSVNNISLNICEIISLQFVFLLTLRGQNFTINIYILEIMKKTYIDVEFL